MNRLLFLLVLSTPVLAQSPQQAAPNPASDYSHSCAPYYPPQAVREHAQGTTMLEFLVTATGTVANITVTKSSGNLLLDEATVKCVGQWRYPPTIKNGVPTAVSRKVNFDWRLDGPSPILSLVESAVQECVGKTHPTGDALAKATGMTVVKIQFHVHEPPSVEVTSSSGNEGLDKLVVDCLSQLHPPINDNFIIPFSWKADAPSSPSISKLDAPLQAKSSTPP